MGLLRGVGVGAFVVVTTATDAVVIVGRFGAGPRECGGENRFRHRESDSFSQ